MFNAHCVIQGCKTTVYNKSPFVSFYGFPSSNEMRNKWLHVLRNKCSSIDWSRSRICSRHFENKYLDSQKKLREYAIPTIFPTKQVDPTKPVIERLLNKFTQSELTKSIKEDLEKLEEPFNLENCVNEKLKCRPDNSEETKLWLVIKKQEHLIARLTQSLNKNKRHTEMLQKNLEEYKHNKQGKDQSTESQKYIIKCLQEKLATYEEQIEILTCVESL